MSFIESSTVFASICYFLATFSVLSKLFDSKGPNQVLVLMFACFAIIPHTVIASHQLMIGQEINFNLPNVITLVSLIITLTVTAGGIKYKLNLLLPVIYGFAGTWLIITTLLPEVAHMPLAITQAAVISHITLSLISYCVLVIACLYSFQVAYINMKLKAKKLAAVSHLPPLMLVEKQLFNILALGTLCLIATEITGILFLEQLFSSENAHKTILSMFALATYITILWGHYKQGWRGHKVLTLTLFATTLLTLSYFGSRFVKEFLL